MPRAIPLRSDAELASLSEGVVTAHPEAEGIVPLGHDHGTFFYLSRASRQVLALTAREHTRQTLLALASGAHYWQRSRFLGEKGNIRWDDAIDWMMEACRDRGIYDGTLLRGRGAWLDGSRSVVHLGDRLVVDGAPTGLSVPGSRHIYEAAPPLGVDAAAPLDAGDAKALIEICRLLRWRNRVDGTLLAGWIALAPVCGALAWRPSIWLSGGAGAGKSWILEHIVSAALGPIALSVQSRTSEAGIRQALGRDARPILFDEAEAEDAGSAARMQGVLELVRQSSSESGAEIVKGTPSGRVQRYRVRSCWLFCSINTAVRAQADVSRITVLDLAEPGALTEEGKLAEAQRFAKLRAAVSRTITPAFSGALLARSAALLPTIRANAEAFAAAAAGVLGSRRDGDQLGALLAGAYSLGSSRAVTEAEATEYVSRHDWPQLGSESTERDEVRLLRALTQHRLRISAGNGVAIDATVGRLMAAALGQDPQIVPEIADRELRQTGVRLDSLDGARGFWVSNSHPALAAALRGTPWGAGWARALRRLPGTATSSAVIRFGFGHVARPTWIPESLLVG